MVGDVLLNMAGIQCIWLRAGQLTGRSMQSSFVGGLGLVPMGLWGRLSILNTALLQGPSGYSANGGCRQRCPMMVSGKYSAYLCLRALLGGLTQFWRKGHSLTFPATKKGCGMSKFGGPHQDSETNLGVSLVLLIMIFNMLQIIALNLLVIPQGQHELILS